MNWSIFLIFSLGAFKPAYSNLTYGNDRIDHALYDGHDAKTVVMGRIVAKEELVVPEGTFMLDGPEGPLSIGLAVQDVLMGKEALAGTTLKLPTASFDWPKQLVALDTGNFCFLVLQEEKYGEEGFSIRVVIPVNMDLYNSLEPGQRKFENNAKGIKFFENQLIAEIGNENTFERYCALLEQVGPILSKGNASKLVPLLKHENEWVKRAALADMVYATGDEEYIKLLAQDANDYFNLYPSDETITFDSDYTSYAPYPLYYRFVFFLEPNDRQYGTRWNEEEAATNASLVEKLKATELLNAKAKKRMKL